MNDDAPSQFHRTLFAGVLGAGVLAAGLVAVSFNAGAGSSATLSEPSTTTVAPPPVVDTPITTIAEDGGVAAVDEAWADFDACMSATGAYDEASEGDDWEANEAAYDECAPRLPEEVRLEQEAWNAYDDCLQNELGAAYWEDEAWDESAHHAADLACRGVLTQAMQDEMAAYDAHDACYREHAGPYDEPYAGMVSVEMIESYESYLFTDDDATITISKVDGDISVSVDGEVIVQDEAYWEAQEARWQKADEACAHLLPEYEH